MNYMLILLLVIIILIGLLVWAKYNSFIYLSNLVSEAWSGINVQLKRRYDLIPNLVETVKGYSKHEKSVFENVTRLRTESMSARSVEHKSELEGELSGALKTLFAVAENYPDLKANQNFLQLQAELQNIEGEIQLARRYYNGVVRSYNTNILTFPGNLIAMFFSFKPKHYFEIAKEEQENVQINFE